MTIYPESAFDYDPYGVVLRQYTTGPEPYLTTQHERDAETGLDYRGARFYDAEVGHAPQDYYLMQYHLNGENENRGKPAPRDYEAGSLSLKYFSAVLDFYCNIRSNLVYYVHIKWSKKQSSCISNLLKILKR